jgi:ketose-bisphosphate aldolase
MIKNYLEKARKEKWAIGQFNFSTFDQLKSIIETSKKMRAPIILGTSKKEVDFFGIQEVVNIVSFYKKRDNAKIFLNLDHEIDFERIKRAIDLGYDMVHFDGSIMKIEDNIKDAVKVLNYAHRRNVLVEGEVGRIFGKSSIYSIKKAKIDKTKLASIEDIDLFIKKTKIDLLALGVGNVHGVEKPSIDFNILIEAGKRQVPLVLHGGSGILDKDIKKAIKCGVAKININTELRIAWKEGLKKSIKGLDLAPYDLLLSSQKAVSLKVEEKIKLFNSKGKI